jgi:antitoxin component YwqK of YwqJK toxin-antitoxin module
LLTGASFAQVPTAPNAHDAQGFRTGTWTEFYDSLHSEVADRVAAHSYRVITYLAGTPVGMTTEYYLRNGAVRWTGLLRSVHPDVADGAVASFYENGTPSSSGWVEHGLLEGPWKFQNEEGAIVAEGGYVTGVQEGPWMLRTETQIAGGSFVHGVRQGPWSFFAETSVLRCDYRDGRLHGIAVTRYTDSTCFMIPYVDGIATGISEQYATNGARIAIGMSHNGTRIGTWEYRTDAGVLLGVENHGDGEGEGFSISWNPDGSLVAIGGMRNGRMSGVWTFVYPNGKMSAAGSYVDGITDGLWQTWYENGNLRSSGIYRDGTRSGEWMEWREDGVRIEVGTHASANHRSAAFREISLHDTSR